MTVGLGVYIQHASNLLKTQNDHQTFKLFRLRNDFWITEIQRGTHFLGVQLNLKTAHCCCVVKNWKAEHEGTHE